MATRFYSPLVARYCSFHYETLQIWLALTYKLSRRPSTLCDAGSFAVNMIRHPVYNFLELIHITAAGLTSSFLQYLFVRLDAYQHP
ncbi:hypothetical protein C8R45DRAFT_1114678 [Mycena sanguinolenta]|nr:hypothetical protein C8R45DRAFT_1114678 [Mycena sanguinolenta]